MHFDLKMDRMTNSEDIGKTSGALETKEREKREKL